MATPNFGYQIFEPNDVPTWLGSWNNTMTQIDRDLASANTSATTAVADIKLAQQDIIQIQQAIEKLNNGSVTQEDAITALQSNVRDLQTNLTNAENRINDISAAVGVSYSGNLSEGETTLTLSAPAINENSTIDVYTDVFGVSPKEVVVDLSRKIIILTFETRESLLKVKVRVGE